MTFEKNDSVRIIDGPFANFSGKVDEVNPDAARCAYGDHFRTRHAGGTRIPASRKDSMFRTSMAKKVTGQVKLQIPAGKATPAPPVGTALGPQGVNIMDFCKAFNAKTSARTRKA